MSYLCWCVHINLRVLLFVFALFICSLSYSHVTGIKYVLVKLLIHVDMYFWRKKRLKFTANSGSHLAVQGTYRPSAEMSKWGCSSRWGTFPRQESAGWNRLSKAKMAFHPSWLPKSNGTKDIILTWEVWVSRKWWVIFNKDSKLMFKNQLIPNDFVGSKVSGQWSAHVSLHKFTLTSCSHRTLWERKRRRERSVKAAPKCEFGC